MYFRLQLKKCFRRRPIQSYIYVAKKPFIKQCGCDENDLVEDNFSSLTGDLFLKQVVDSNGLNRIMLDCFVSENHRQWQRIFLNVLMGGSSLPNIFWEREELLKVYEIYNLNKGHYTKMLSFHKFWGCFLPDFHFLNLVGT